MKFDLRDLCKLFFLCIVSINLGLSSDCIFIGIIFVFLFIYLFLTRKKREYKRIFAYLAIIPCAICWIIVPSTSTGISPYMVYIPGFYFLFLAFLQNRSLHNGGFDVFIIFNGVLALLCGLYNAPRYVYILSFLALFFLAYAYSRPKTHIYKNLLFLLLFILLSLSSWIGYKYWKSHHLLKNHWYKNYEEKHRIMGFDPVVSLGSFENNYTSNYNSQVVLRVWDTSANDYLKAAVYEKYIGGIWKLPNPIKKLYPSYYQIDYPVFEIADSSTIQTDVKRVWVQSSLDNFGFFFSSKNALGVSAKNIDSLDFYSTGVFYASSVKRSDWFYFENKKKYNTKDLFEDDNYLHINLRYESWLDSVAKQMNLPKSRALAENLLIDKSYIDSNLTIIEHYFLKNFKYSLVLSLDNKDYIEKEPLKRFWKNKQGYCEYFASLATLLLRYQGIQARYVTGFVNPERVKGRSYVLFRRYNSHAWVEFKNDSWEFFDPTPPISHKVNVEESIFLIKLESLKGLTAYALHFLKEGKWRQVADEFENYLNQLVNKKFVFSFVFLVCFFFLIKKILKRKQIKLKTKNKKRFLKWINQLELAEKKLSHYGYKRYPGETVLSFIKRLSNESNLPSKVLEAINSLKEYESNRWKILQ